MKVINQKDAVQLIKSNSTLAVSGFAGVSVPESLLKELEKRFIREEKPKDITLMFAAGQGEGKEKGLNHLAHEGLIKRVIGAHYNLAPKIGQMIINNKIEAYNFPQGVICNMFRDIARKSGFTISRVGVGTFVDPRYEGGKANDMTKEDLVKLIDINGKKNLIFNNENINAAFIKGTYSDKNGNISMEHEATYSEAFTIAQAVRNCGGIVIVQVDEIIKNGKIQCDKVKIPGIYVDYVIEVRDDLENEQILGLGYDGNLCGKIKENDGHSISYSKKKIDVMKENNILNPRNIIGKRAFTEIAKGDVINIGIGIPEEVSKEVERNKFNDFITLTVEPGAIGGVPQSGMRFGSSYDPECIIDQVSQFDFYDGGGLNISFLGMAECDKSGNINVSRFGSKIPGCGGFIDITQNSKKCVFCGTFTAGGLEISVKDGKMKILKEGINKKFVHDVNQITFNGRLATENDEDIIYVTERAVFKLFRDGLHIIEIAPGIDLENDILDLMEFKPVIDRNISVMDEYCFFND
ncbi:MAG: malonate decarboxylase subunit alpha [Clostridium sp.]|nr:malonate decarboxylase subunit alpha [Clostridium sp.]